MKLYQFAFVPFAFLAVACGGDSSISIVGQPPEQQADTLADASCDAQVECGEVNFDFGTDPETQMPTCVATIEDADYEACIDETRPEIYETLSTCELSAEDEQVIQDCFNAQLALPCISQAQLDAYCDEIEAGNEPESPGETPAVCEEMFAIIEACETPA